MLPKELEFFGGRRGIRTLDPRIANAVSSPQLSRSPTILKNAHNEPFWPLRPQLPKYAPARALGRNNLNIASAFAVSPGSLILRTHIAFRSSLRPVTFHTLRHPVPSRAIHGFTPPPLPLPGRSLTLPEGFISSRDSIIRWSLFLSWQQLPNNPIEPIIPFVRAEFT